MFLNKNQSRRQQKLQKELYDVSQQKGVSFTLYYPKLKKLVKQYCDQKGIEVRQITYSFGKKETIIVETSKNKTLVFLIPQ